MESPQNLDWISVRSSCTLAEVFSALRFGIEGDVNAINKTYRLEGAEAFALKTIEPNGFVVYKTKNSGRSVRFFLEENGIEIYDDITNQKHSAGITLTNEGRCKLRIEAEELEQWQVRRIALESMFFEGRG